VKSASVSSNSLSKIFHSLPQLERYFELQHAVHFMAHFHGNHKILQFCFEEVFLVERRIAFSLQLSDG